MKRNLFLCLFLTLLFCKSYGQSTPVILECKDKPLLEIIEELEQNFDLLFSYKSEDVEDVRITTNINVSNISLAIEKLLKNTPLTHSILEGNFVAITAATNSESSKFKLCGTVIDNETGEPLAFANIFIPEKNLGTSTQSDGSFQIISDGLNDIIVEVSYIGYQTKEISSKVISKGDCPEIIMKIKKFSEYLVIEDYILDGIDLDDNGAATRLSPRRIGSVPGYAESDVTAITKFLPGIASPSSRADDIRIRGCSPDQNLVLWEDIPIYHVGHYFGMVSATNPFIIDDIKVYRGGFGAEYGGRIAGVLDMKSPDERTHRPYLGVGTNMTNAYIYGSKMLPVKRPAAITFSVRRSFSEITQTPTIKNITTVNQQGLLLGSKEVISLPDHITVEDQFDYLDANLKFSMQATPKDRLSISGIFATNSFSDEIVDDRRKESQEDIMELNNKGASFSWEHSHSDKWTSSIKGIATSYDYNYVYDLKSFNQQPRVSGMKDNMISDNQIHLNIVYVNDQSQSFEGGYQLTNYNISYQAIEESTLQKDINDGAHTESILHSLFFNFKNPIDRKVGVNAGFRSSYFNIGKKVFLEPRIRLSFKVSSALSIHSSYGRHHQFVSQINEFRGNDTGISTELWALAEEQNVPVQQADMYQVGAIYKVGSWLFDLQLYNHQIDGLSSRAFLLDEIENGKPKIGSSDITGLDLLIKKRYKKFRSWLSYSLSKNDFRFPAIQKAPFASDFDQRHVLNWNNILQVKDFEISVGYRYSTGLPYSRILSFDVIPNPNGPDDFVPLYDGINVNRLNGQQEVNLSVLYKINAANKHGIKGYLTLSISNILDRENLSSRVYNIDDKEGSPPVIQILDTRNLGFQPNLSFRVEW